MFQLQLVAKEVLVGQGMGHGVRLLAARPEFDFQDPHGGKRAESYGLSPDLHMLAEAGMSIYIKHTIN